MIGRAGATLSELGRGVQRSNEDEEQVDDGERVGEGIRDTNGDGGSGAEVLVVREERIQAAHAKR
jgi:hypothetical protein